MIVCEFFDDELEKITRRIPLSYETIGILDDITIYPAKHFVTSK